MRVLTQIMVLAAFGLLTLEASGRAAADTVLITGANQGIGLEFAKEYAARGWTVIAASSRDHAR